MSTEIINKFLRVGEGRAMKGRVARVERITKREPEFEKLSDEELRERSDALRARAKGGESLDDLLDEASHARPPSA
jgi:preprotein translocase subunit SecA